MTLRDTQDAEPRLPKLSANLTFLFNEVPFPERFEAAANAGFDAVEFMFPYEHIEKQLGDLLERHGLGLDTFNLPAGDFAAGERGMAVFPGRRGEFKAGVETALRYAAALGTSKLNCLVGLRDPSLTWDEQYQCLVENLRWAADRIGREGVTLQIEPLSPPEVPNFFLDSVGLAERILEEIGSPDLRIQFDVYHVQRAQGDVVTALRRTIDLLGHVQVADSPGRGEPGSGELNFNYILTELDRLGYEGYVGLEYRPTQSTVESLNWLEGNGWHGDH
jgi:hydroxypyruvate isomerase